MLRRLSLVIAGATLIYSIIVATHADVQNASEASGVPPRASLVGREIVYPNGVMVSLDAGTGLSSPTINPDSANRATVISCSPGYICLYENANYGGRRLQFRDRDHRDQCINLSNYGFNDKISSVRNQSNVDVRLFYGANCSGTSRCLNPGSGIPFLGSGDNKFSSLWIYTTATAC
jgi:hypothetical protein